MQCHVKFKSQRYMSCDWSALLKSCYENNNISEFPTVIANHNRLLIPESFKGLDKIHVLTPEYKGTINVSDLEFVEHIFLNQCRVNLANLSSSVLRLSVHDGSDYVKTCAEVCNKSLILIHNILRYSHDHLENRESEGIKLAQHEAIQLSLATAVCHLDYAGQLLSIAKDIHAIQIAFNYLLQALHIIAQLNGGRAMLRGNAIDLMFHLNIFQSVFTSVRN